MPSDVERSGTLREAVERLLDEPLDDVTKGLPAGARVTLRSIGDQGWNLFAGDLPLPLVVLDPDAVRHNIALMQTFADDHGAWLAPHGKTTMAPQIWDQQLAAGAWGLTVATPAQLQVASAFGVPRIIVANEPVTEYEYRLLAREIREGREVSALVDDPDSTARLAAGLQRAGVPRPLPVLIEFGVSGGRTGTRDLSSALAVADEVARHPVALRLAGVEAFEATASASVPGDPVGAVDAVLDRVLVATHELVERRGVPAGEAEPFIVSAGGSGFFDRVVAVLEGRLPAGCRLVLRPGTYVTHDAGMYDALSPLGSGPAGRLPGDRLRSALTLWAEVLSRPEPELAIVNSGRRDSPADGDVPRPRWRLPRDAAASRRAREPEPLDAPATVFAANDQHMYLRIPAGSPVRPGDVIGFGVSHPCLVMDRWRVVLLAQQDGSVVGGIRTFF